MIVVRNGAYGRAVKMTKTPGELTVRSLTPATWDTAGRRITASFLYNATRSLFESYGRNLWMSPRMRARRTFHPDL
jgi:hypothetical protein